MVVYFADAATGALGALRNKTSKLKDIHFSAYTKLFNSGVAPILDYCSVFGVLEIINVLMHFNIVMPDTSQGSTKCVQFLLYKVILGDPPTGVGE